MEPARLTALASVCCLDCGKVYGKPTGGGTLWANPGCPHCGYVGWLPHTEWFSEAWPRDRSAADRRSHRRTKAG